MTIPRRTLLALSASAAAGAMATAAARPHARPSHDAAPPQPDAPAPWWQEAVFYEIYPKSFQDGNGDGFGDFIGMGDRIDHVRDLGATAIWVAACFDSPNADNGYDVRDYRRIMPQLGTMDAFDYFMGRAKKRNIRVILDMVFNHTSDEHPWFVQSRASRDNPFRDYYIWRDGHDGGPPTNWQADGGGSAWTLDARTGQYYLHSFLAKEPDLNWNNPKLRQELYDILKFWIDRGAAGFRFDSITRIAKPAVFADQSPADAAAGKPFCVQGPRLVGYLRDMHAHVFADTDLYAVGEAWNVDHKEFIAIADPKSRALSSGFRFGFAQTDIVDNWRKLPPTLDALRAFNADNAFDDHPSTWPVSWIEDHDFPRAVSRYGSHDPRYRDRSAKLLLTLTLSLRGTPFLYQGQEIGMENYPFSAIAQFDDVDAHKAWQAQVASGHVPAADMLANLAASSRDNARTPMQWSAARNAGFSTGHPWMPVNPDYRTINVARQADDPNSTMAFTTAMIALRRAHAGLVHGRYRDISPPGTTIYAYRRDHVSGSFLVVLNFSDATATFALPPGTMPGPVLIGNIAGSTRSGAASGPALDLAPWESLVMAVPTEAAQAPKHATAPAAHRPASRAPHATPGR